MQEGGAESHGIKEAFSTASQPQYPPQPSSEYDQRAPSRMPIERKIQATRAKRRVERIQLSRGGG